MSELPPEPEDSDVLSYAPSPPKGAMFAIFMVALVDMLGFGLVVPLLPFYARSFDASALQVTLLFSIFSVCQFVAAPILGAWSDRVGRKRILAISLIGNALGYSLLGWATQHQWHSLTLGLMTVYLSRIISGLTAGNISAAQAYISDITTPQNRAKGMGILGAAFGLGFSLGPAIGGLLAHYLDPSTPAWAAAGLAIFAAILAAAKLVEAQQHRPTETTSYLHPAQFMPLLRNRPLMKINTSWFVAMAAFVAVDSSIVLFLMDLFKYAEGQVAYYFLTVGLVIMITQGGLVGRLTQRFGEWPLCIWGLGLNGLGALLTAATAWWTQSWLLFLAAVIYAFGRSLFQPTISALVSHHSHPKQQGLSFGFFQAVGTFARVVGPIGAGLLYDWRLTSPWLAATGVLWITSLALLHLRRAEDEPAGDVAISPNTSEAS